MSIQDIAKQISEWPLSVAIREGDYSFPIIECFHVLALALVFGSIAAVDLRLIGVSARNVPVSKLASNVLPVTWTAFAVAVVTGALMFIATPNRYIINFSFQMKLILLALAGLNMAAFHLTTWKRVNAWDLQMPPPLAARLAGGLSLLIWIAIIFFGRWIGFTLARA